ncbi:MAG TPA: serine/threonine-protein kinase [Pseudonocardiaceae bacterium]|nr:serine/threonine-protein kinase [Pseudonocardiaceae bacterium]
MGRREAPVPDGPLHDFAEGLRELRANAPDRPTYRELARVACFSQSVLSVAASGRVLPTWEVTLAYVAACGGNVEQWRETWVALHDRLRSTDPGLITEPEPRPGPNADRDNTPGEPAAAQPDEPELPPSVNPLRRSDPRAIGPFRLLGRLGGGAMGQVYLGMSKAGRPVSVKVVHPHLAEDQHFRRRFAAEVGAVRRVHGIYTPAVVDSDPGAELPWMATAYVAGPSLSDLVENDGPLPSDTVLRLAAGIAEALANIHGAGLLHRDLKPANVLLSTDGPSVIDFGVSFVAGGTSLTQTGTQVGTAPFLAPEQVNGTPLTGAADVFSLGSLLAYAATGIPPFGDGSPGEVLYRIVHSPPDPKALDGTSSTLREVIVRCLDKDPDRRPTPEQIVEACSADRPPLRWLPAMTADRITRSRAATTALVSKARTRRRTATRWRRAGLPVLALAMVAAATVILVPRWSGGTPQATAPLPSTRSSPPRSTAPPVPAPYTLVYHNRRLNLPNYSEYIDLKAGTVVEGHNAWTMSSDSGGDSRGAFEIPDATSAYLPSPARPTLTAAECAAGVATHPAATGTLGSDVILRFDWVPPGSSFCLRFNQTGDLAVIRVVDTDNGNYSAKLDVDFYQHLE